VTDEFTNERLAIDVDGGIRSPRVIEVLLSRLVSGRGAPRFLRSDNGPEFVLRKLPSRMVAQNIDIALIEPGKPWQDAVGASVNRKFRDECLSLEWLRSRAEALWYVRPARLAPLHHRPIWGNHSKQDPSSQVNRGRKTLGRSLRPVIRPTKSPDPVVRAVGSTSLRGARALASRSPNPVQPVVNHAVEPYQGVRRRSATSQYIW
jgi:hypothetical protein